MRKHAGQLSGHRATPGDGQRNGLDRRALKLAITVVLIVGLWIGVVPLINHFLHYDDPIKDGQQLLVAPGITFTPPTGWNLEQGLRTTDKTRTKATGSPIELVEGAITMTVDSAPFKGTPEELVEKIEKTPFSNEDETLNATGEKLPVLVSGTQAEGIIEHYTAPSSEGIAAAFVLDGTGVTVKVVGPSAQMSDDSDQIGESIGSFVFDQKAAESANGAGK